MKPLELTNGSQRLAVVSDQAVADFGFAVTYGRVRLYLNMDMPLVTKGDKGTFGGYQYNFNASNPSALSVDLGSNPDTLSDARIGFDARLLGGPRDAFRLGAGFQLVVPGGRRDDYDSDGTYRGMLRVLAAGDIGAFSYAGQVGLHIRPLDDSPIPGSPQGSEMLFGGAAGLRLPLGFADKTDLILGPEVFGATACKSAFGTDTTALEALLSSRVEQTQDDGLSLRVKLGAGVGLNPHFGAPDSRVVVAIELFDHNSDRDGDGIPDSKDACPDQPGPKTSDPRTNGCPVKP
jgi:hypothetical protein